MKALVGAFNQEKALVGAFSVIVQPVVEPMELYTALPRWVPMARSKMFKNPPESTISKDERKHIHELNEEYMKRIKALQFYVYEDDLKAGDTGEAAVIAAEREEESHLVNLKVKDIEYGVILYLFLHFRKMKKKIKELQH